MKELSYRKLKIRIPENYKKAPLPSLNKWLAALRNPEAKQVKGMLCSTTEQGEIKGECCLGVYCRIHDLPHEVIPSADSDHPFARRYLDEVGHLPMRLVRQLQKVDPSNKSDSLSLQPEYFSQQPKIEFTHAVKVQYTDDDWTFNHPDVRISYTCFAVTLNDTSNLSFTEIADVLEHIFVDKEDYDRSNIQQSKTDDTRGVQEAANNQAD